MCVLLVEAGDRDTCLRRVVDKGGGEGWLRRVVDG